MSKEVIIKKLEQLKALIDELGRLLDQDWDAFRDDLVKLRAAERNFQLAVELASDINTTLLIDKTGKTPDTYRQSFSGIEKLGILSGELSEVLVNSAKLRNILVHEYDFEEDYEKFYNSAKGMIPSYREYIKVIHDYIKSF